MSAYLVEASLPDVCEVCGGEQRALIAEPGSMDSTPVLCPHCVWLLPVLKVVKDGAP